jgi:hypothetical protein
MSLSDFDKDVLKVAIAAFRNHDPTLRRRMPSQCSSKTGLPYSPRYQATASEPSDSDGNGFEGAYPSIVAVSEEDSFGYDATLLNGRCPGRVSIDLNSYACTSMDGLGPAEA